MRIKERNKKIQQLAKAHDIEGLREFFKSDPYANDVTHGDRFLTEDDFAHMCCDAIIKASRENEK